MGPQTIAAPSRSGFGGVAVAASNSDYIASIGIAAGEAGTAAISLSGSVAVVTVHTTAAVGDYSKINCGDATCAQDGAGASGNQSLLVSAENNFRTLGIAASIAIAGDADVGASATVRVMELHDDAYLGAHVIVNTTNNVELHADSSDSVISVNAAAAAGPVGVAGTVGVSVIQGIHERLHGRLRRAPRG